MAIVLCRRCRSRLLGLAVSPSPSHHPQQLLVLLRPRRRSLRPSPPKVKIDRDDSTKLFIRRIAQLPESPFSPSPSSPAGVAVQLAVRIAAAVAAGGLLCLSVRERRLRQQASAANPNPLLPFDFGYFDIDDVTASGWDQLLRSIRLSAPCLAFCLTGVIVGNLLRSKRLSATSLASICRHAFDKPGRSAPLTSPWLSSFCSLHGTEFLFTSCALAIFSQLSFGYSPEEKILAFITGALAGSASRCAYQQLLLPLISQQARSVSHWYGAHAGLAMLAGLQMLSWRRSASAAQRLQQEKDGAAPHLAGMSRSAQRALLEMPHSLCTVLLIGWAVYDLAILALPRWRQAPVIAIGAVAQSLKHASSLAGLIAACGVHAATVWLLPTAVAFTSASTSAATSSSASASAIEVETSN